MGQQKINHPLFNAVLGFAASGILLTVIQAPWNLHFLAWLAWVPFMLACKSKLQTGRLLLSAYFIGLCYWVGNLYWLYIITIAGYLAFAVMQGLYWPVLAWLVRFAQRKNWPLALMAPVIFVGAEAWQGILYTGFCWYYLAHSQYRNLSIIQICDIFGALGLSALIALVNGVIAQWIIDRRSGRTAAMRTFWSAAAAVLLIMLTLAYGQHRIRQTPAYLSRGPLVGMVQPNVPAWIKEEMDNGQKILDDLIADSNECIKAGAVMAAWPETMVLAPLNQEYLDLCVANSDPPRFHRQIIEHCKDRAYILAGAHGAAIGIQNGRYAITDQYNSAYLYRPDGTADPQRYDKIHLVPFGEYIPFRDTIPWLYKAILWLSPYDYDYNLTPGKEFTTFEIKDNSRVYRFGVLICYEDTDPTVTRKLAVGPDGKKKADWLVNLSNDGWYVRFKNGRVYPMAELAQRTAISVFRCVENRISIVRSVNTGISCLIEPTGRIRNGFLAGTLPAEAMDRQGVRGWFVDRVPIDSRITFFSRHGRWLDVVFGAGWSIILIWSIYDVCRKHLRKDK
ncbi:MAG TPA: apolipoprotein N-acyltransferase [Anaerohalosphaeraceae bacterium]|nr:apolipoprotein N-acyltransferase [Anaerohalosphaeraceae bacterium]HOL31818.1 apolipoprotein N-acyltransferase [Anaerohalosphaeraceae bacterium]HOM75486.1 apolipoprotein N-acyltransferase [Anaerohalosphaeraceae bacterium]HPC63786.1 apolipoprotein N-acyltransferase [Anaerohalosphaeraceae bacterium]HPO70678.1 apolipoprotein N-acyltransferase [Anaerohalosphaeraceae bacterium]